MLLNIELAVAHLQQCRKGRQMFQFAHINSYSRVTPKIGKAGGHSVSSILAEASRTPGNIPHVANPQLPLYLYGRPLSELEAACDLWAITLKDARGRNIRKDALCLLAGVISAPAGIEREAWEKLKKDSVTWLRKKYGDRLQTVVEHVDEANPHLHFYCIPLPGERFDQIHDGKKAAAMTKQWPKGEQNAAYRKAMRAWQDEFSADVGIPNGMSRFGPRKRRLSRDAWRQEQHAHGRIATSLAASHELAGGAKAQAAEILWLAKSNAAALHSNTIKTAEFNALHAFAKKNILARIIEMITGFARDNTALRQKTKSLERKLSGQSTRAVKYYDQASKYSEILNRVRPAYTELSETVGHLKIINRNLLSDLDVEREGRSIAENKLIRALSNIKALQAEADIEPESANPVRRDKILCEEYRSGLGSDVSYRR